MARAFRTASMIACALAVAGAVSAQDQYRRWLDNGKTFTCTTVAGPAVNIVISNQDIEFNNLPADAQYTLNYFDNGNLVNSDGPYTVEQTSGTRSYGPFLESIPGGYPARFDFRIDTIINSQVVYQSTLTATCTGPSPTPAPVAITNLAREDIPVPATSRQTLVLLALGVALLGYALLRRALA